ncbi:MAG: signal peptidase I [Eubacterium sp.]|nr:signal peptidase I [Eubacterium sp.]
MKNAKKATLKWQGIIRIVLLVVCGIVLGANVYHINAKSLVGDQLPMPFGYGTAIVLSGSMEPELSAGDLILVKETNDIKENDIVVYQQSGSLVVHRVIEMDDSILITKGDANNVADAPIVITDVKGKVFASIPAVGNLIGFIKSPVGTIIIIIVAIALVEIPRRREKQKDEEERQQIIDEIKRLKDE